MPPIETMDLYQKAVLWEATGTDGYGQYVFADDPTELDVRWVNKRREASDSQGNPITIDATVIVAQDVEVGSLMWLGNLADVPGTSGIPESNLMQVVNFDRTTSLKNEYVRYELSLVRYKDDVPV